MPLTPPDGRRRVTIEDVHPQIDAGHHHICRVAEDEVVVTAAIFANGKNGLAGRLTISTRSADRQMEAFLPMSCLTTSDTPGVTAIRLRCGRASSRRASFT